MNKTSFVRPFTINISSMCAHSLKREKVEDILFMGIFSYLIINNKIVHKKVYKKTVFLVNQINNLNSFVQ